VPLIATFDLIPLDPATFNVWGGPLKAKVNELVAAANSAAVTVVDNGDGTFTITDGTGTIVGYTTAGADALFATGGGGGSTVTIVDNGDGIAVLTTSSSPGSGGGTGGTFTLGTTKPTAANTGAGVIRAYPTGTAGTLTGNQSFSSGTVTGQTINGNVTLSGTAQLMDCVVHGHLIMNDSATVAENCVIDGYLTAPTGHTWMVDSTNATQGGRAQIRYSTIVGRVTSYYLNGIGKRNFYAYRCDVSGVVDTLRIEPTGVGGVGNVLVEGCFTHDMQYCSPDPTHTDDMSHDDGCQLRGGTDITLTGNTIHGNWSSTVGTNPQPGIPSNLSCIMLTPDIDQIVATFDRNWFDYGVDLVNGGDADLTSASILAFTGNRFGRHYTRKPFNVKATVTLTDTGNVWEDTGAALTATRP
jgi:hypothetical protein